MKNGYPTNTKILDFIEVQGIKRNIVFNNCFYKGGLKYNKGDVLKIKGLGRTELTFNSPEPINDVCEIKEIISGFYIPYDSTYLHIKLRDSSYITNVTDIYELNNIPVTEQIIWKIANENNK